MKLPSLYDFIGTLGSIKPADLSTKELRKLQGALDELKPQVKDFADQMDAIQKTYVEDANALQPEYSEVQEKMGQAKEEEKPALKDKLNSIQAKVQDLGIVATKAKNALREANKDEEVDFKLDKNGKAFLGTIAERFIKPNYLKVDAYLEIADLLELG